MKSVADNLQAVRERMANAAMAAGRPPEAVRLLAVSKAQGAQAVQQAAAAGQTSFGENYLQEALPKMQALPALDWHFIGAIQSNKTSALAERFAWVHSLASAKAGQRLHRQRAGPPLKALIQVNTSQEATKSGIAPDGLRPLVASLLEAGQLELKGLMAIPAQAQTEASQRKAFASLRELAEQVRAEFQLHGFTELSMGMSHDFEAAIREGATWVRLGTAIFGERP